jgi:hypothetical protein
MSKLQENPSALKRGHPTLQTWTFTKFFYYSGSFLPSWIRIPNPDPDPLTRLNPDSIRIRNPAFDIDISIITSVGPQTVFVIILCVARLPVCPPPPPPIPPASEAGCALLACGRAFPLVSIAHPSLYSIRQGAENSPAIPPVADSWYFAIRLCLLFRLFIRCILNHNKYFYCLLFKVLAANNGNLAIKGEEEEEKAKINGNGTDHSSETEQVLGLHICIV